MEKYGFIYIWRDKKHNRYYIGSHWGKEDDGYICSSNWMRDAFRRRPEDFKRRIIERIYTNHTHLLLKEDQYLKMINPIELGKKYYNLKGYTQKTGAWYTDEYQKKTISEKLSLAHKGKKLTEQTKEKMRGPRKPYGPQTEEHRRKLIENHSGMTGKKHSKEAREKIANTRRLKNIPNPMLGRKHSDETKEKMRISRLAVLALKKEGS